MPEWDKDEGLKKNFKYLVLGDGATISKNILEMLKLWKIHQPIPSFFFAQTPEEAEKVAMKMRPWHSRVYVCEILDVHKRIGEDL